MQDLGEAIGKVRETMLAGRTPERVAAAAAVVELVRLWDAGHATTEDVARYTTPRQRADAYLWLPTDDPAWPAFGRLLDALIDGATDEAGEAYYRTTHGIFSSGDIRAAAGRVFRDPQRGVGIEFPAAQDNGQPTYRRDQRRGTA